MRELAQVPGPVYALLTDGSDAVVSHGDGVSRIAPDGRRIDVPCPHGWTVRRCLSQDRLLLVDFNSTRAAILEPDGRLIPVTDENDHAAGRTGELEKIARTAPDSGRPAPTVEVANDWVVVDDVRVPRRP